MTAADDAIRYWRVACLIAATHVFGLTWPPPGRPQRRRLIGHWGCNPGIAWAVGHLAARWPDGPPLQLVVGTGHASSFVFAHHAMRAGWGSEEITAAARDYGQPGGTASELLHLPAPYIGGELGPALAVSQGMAAHLAAERTVVCVIGDGEAETPSALAALAHGEVILGGRDRAGWIAVVNHNGARMGGPSRFGVEALRRLGEATGHLVVVSDHDPRASSAAAEEALDGAAVGRRVLWISCTEKGWPLDARLTEPAFRGAAAHKPSAIDLTADRVRDRLHASLEALRPADAIGPNGRVPPQVQTLAQRVGLAVSDAPRPALKSNRRQDCGDARRNASPMGALDAELAERGVRSFCPDEGRSNVMGASMDAGLVTEVLSEETCIAWTWGTIESGVPAAFVTYEAFAPLASSTVAQYAKLVSSRPAADRPPLLVVQTSLGWANAPTHQNCDMAATALARLRTGVNLVAPIGATSARERVGAALCRRDRAVVVVASKQVLPDLPDPGSACVELSVDDGERGQARTIVAFGDVCVAEAVAAMVLAERVGVPVRVIALVDVGQALRTGSVHGLRCDVAAMWAARAHALGALAELSVTADQVRGYVEAWGPTRWETLCRNGLDRASILHDLLGDELADSAGDVTKQPEAAPTYDLPPIIGRPMA